MMGTWKIPESSLVTPCQGCDRLVPKDQIHRVARGGSTFALLCLDCLCAARDTFRQLLSEMRGENRWLSSYADPSKELPL